MRYVTPYWLICLAVVCLWRASGLATEASAPDTLPSPPSFVPQLIGDSASFEGCRIDSIVVETRNVFNTADPKYNNILTRTANKLHFVSRPNVVRREILFSPGQNFSWDLAAETARNLRTRYDLYDAWVVPQRLPSGGLLLRVITQDQWSLLVGARIKRDANLLDYQFSIEDRNLIGLNQFLSFDYHAQEDHENFVVASFRDQRILGRPYSFEISSSSKPTDLYTRIGLSRPYYSLSQSLSYGVQWEDDGGRIDYYFDSAKVADAHLDGDRFEFTTHYRWGSYRRKIGVLGGYQYQYRRFFDKTGTGIVFPKDSLYHMIYAGGSMENIVYRQVRQVNGFSYVEDVTLGESFQLRYGRAFKARMAGYLFDQVSGDATSGFLVNRNLFLGSVDGSVWFRGTSQFRRSVGVSAKYYNTSLRFMTVATRLSYRYDSGADNLEPLNLGGANGVRGYNLFYLTGNRLALANLELRFFPNVEILSVMFGAAVFGDIGRTWKDRDRGGKVGTAGSFGLGLRISPEKASKLDILRVDLSRTRDSRWEFSFGTGQYF
ncbi:MAG: hypothetical protein WAU88_16110 [Candidatus Zixiibacteriota bacterium]